MLRTSLLLCTLLATFHAQAAEDSKPAELPPVKAGWTLLPDDVPEAKVEEIVTEDNQTRVDELRVRGQVKKVTVHLKHSALPDYEILIRDAQFDTSLVGRTGPDVREGMSGTRVWRVLDF